MVGLALFLATAAHAAPTCDATCLTHVADDYLAALPAHDPAKLHISAAKFTENGVTLPLGQALWSTASTIGTREITFTDPATQSVGFFAIVNEADRPALLSARIKAPGGTVTELETIVARKETASFLDPTGWVADKPILATALTPAEQRPRAALQQIADQYFDAVASPLAPLPPFDPACNRIENGVQTTNKPATGQGNLNNSVSSLGCEEQFKRQTLKFVSRVRDRRYPLIDEGKGLVLALAVFDHDGVVRKEGGLPLASPLPSPYSFAVAELFKIRDGKILEIQAVLSQLPYGMHMAW